MSKMPFTTITPDDDGNATGGLGKRNNSVLKGIFASPFDKTAEQLKKDFFNTVPNGVVDGSAAYYGLASNVSMDYSLSSNADLSTVATGGGGLPASAYLPNPVSPGPDGKGSTDFSTQAPAPDSFVDSHKANNGYGVGGNADSSDRNPAKTAIKIKAAATI